MRQQEADTMCDILYKIRDSVNGNYLAHALVLLNDLRDILIIKITENKGNGCTLDYEAKYGNKS